MSFLLGNLLKQDKEKFVVPKGVQDCIPITAIYDDGIFRVGKDKYSKSFKFTDINFAVASREDKEAMFLEYSELLNSLDSGAILLPENLIKQGMYLFSLGEKIECLNKIYYPSVYKRFDALADFLGCSKKALAIRMKQLGLLKKEYLDNPFDLVTVYPEVSEP